MATNAQFIQGWFGELGIGVDAAVTEEGKLIDDLLGPTGRRRRTGTSTCGAGSAIPTRCRCCRSSRRASSAGSTTASTRTTATTSCSSSSSSAVDPAERKGYIARDAGDLLRRGPVPRPVLRLGAARVPDRQVRRLDEPAARERHAAVRLRPDRLHASSTLASEPSPEPGAGRAGGCGGTGPAPSPRRRRPDGARRTAGGQHAAARRRRWRSSPSSSVGLSSSRRRATTAATRRTSDGAAQPAASRAEAQRPPRVPAGTPGACVGGATSPGGCGRRGHDPPDRLLINFVLFRVMPGSPGADPRAQPERHARAPRRDSASAGASTSRSSPTSSSRTSASTAPGRPRLLVRAAAGRVVEVLGQRIWPTLLLFGLGEVIAIVVGLALGAYSGWRRGGPVDHVGNGAVADPVLDARTSCSAWRSC